MTTTIRADSGGTYGALQINGSDVLRYGSDSSGQLTGFRNYLINGGMQVAQRGNVAVVKDAYTYGGSDRWCVNVAGTTASGTIQRYTGTGLSTNYGAGVQVTTTGSGIIYAQQRIESINSQSLNGKTATLSCYVFQNSGVNKNVYLQLAKPSTTADVFSAQTTLHTSTVASVPSGVLTKLTTTYTLGAAEATLGLVAMVQYVVGAVSAADFYIADVQLEVGSIATPFEVRPLHVEQNACYRYYEASVTSFYSTFFNGNVTTGVVYYSGAARYLVKKRVTPIVVFTNVGASSFPSTVGSAFNSNPDSVQESRIANATANSGIFGSSFTADAEL